MSFALQSRQVGIRPTTHPAQTNSTSRASHNRISHSPNNPSRTMLGSRSRTHQTLTSPVCPVLLSLVPDLSTHPSRNPLGLHSLLSRNRCPSSPHRQSDQRDCRFLITAVRCSCNACTLEQHITAVDGIVPTLQNIVSTVNLDCRLDLKMIALHARNAEHNFKVSIPFS